eukprot:1813212-Rhodomonas_salina.1
MMMPSGTVTSSSKSSWFSQLRVRETGYPIKPLRAYHVTSRQFCDFQPSLGGSRLGVDAESRPPSQKLLSAIKISRPPGHAQAQLELSPSRRSLQKLLVS